MMKRFLCCGLLLAFFISSCEDDIISADPDTGHAYYPVELGAYRIYNVTETTYLRNAPKTQTFQMRERLDEISTDQTGRQWHRVEVSQRTQEGQNWRIIGVKLLSASASEFRILENNQTRVHLVFPVEEGKSWKSNPLNTSIEAESYTYTNVNEPFVSGSQTYDNTITLIQADTDNLLNLNEQYEVLAMGVGPVFRSKRVLNYCNGDPGLTCEVGSGYIVTGTERLEVLVESGVMD